jgi:hypothetical protein
MQTTLGVSFCVLLLVGAGVAACSSDKADPPNSGGNGSVLPGGGAGGTGTSTAGTTGAGSTSAGSTNTPTGGTPSGGTTTGTGGTSTAAQECLATPITCVDEETISGCDPDTLMTITKNCEELVNSQGPGLTAEGCTMIEGRSVCGYDFEDTACRDGAAAFSVCYEAATNDSTIDPLNWYFDCFTDAKYDFAEDGEPEMLVGAHTLIPCFTAYIEGNTIDCEAASEACFPAAPGDGAGGAGP